MRIGIPRALFYHQYYPFWKNFFELLGHEVALSSPTNKQILKKGIELCVDDACLPIKIYHGHVADIMGKVDTIFIPRIVSIEPKEYICPKFLGLPDMIKNSISDLPNVLDAKLNLYEGKIKILDHIFQIGAFLKTNKSRILLAYYMALKAQKQFECQMIEKSMIPQDLMCKNHETGQDQTLIKNPSKITVLLLGHNYNIYDDFISMGLIRKLRETNIAFITSEMVTRENIYQGTKKLSKGMFWTLGKKTIGTAYYYLDQKKIDGIIHVASFGCGPDSLVGELIEKKTKRDYNIPFLYLNLDEHAGEAGFNTRLEAFLDVLEGRGIP